MSEREPPKPPVAREVIPFLSNLVRQQEELGNAVAGVWGRINEEAGAELLEAFRKEGRIQSYVLAARHSVLDHRGIDAVLRLWNQSCMPLDFKSSATGKKNHELIHTGIPCLVVSRADDPELSAARAELMRLIESWHRSFRFKDSDLVQRDRLSSDSGEYLRLKSEVEHHLLSLLGVAVPVSLAENSGSVKIVGISRLDRETDYCKPGGAVKTVLLEGSFLAGDRTNAVTIEFFQGPAPLAWLGMNGIVLLVIPKTGVSTSEFVSLLAVGLQKRLNMQQ